MSLTPANLHRMSSALWCGDWHDSLTICLTPHEFADLDRHFREMTKAPPAASSLPVSLTFRGPHGLLVCRCPELEIRSAKADHELLRKVAIDLLKALRALESKTKS